MVAAFVTPFPVLRQLGADLALARRHGLRLKFALLRARIVISYLGGQAAQIQSALAHWRADSRRSGDWSSGDPGLVWLAFAASATLTTLLLGFGLAGLPVSGRGINWAERLMSRALPGAPGRAAAKAEPVLALAQES